jgi:hypothetical protein
MVIQRLLIYFNLVKAIKEKRGLALRQLANRLSFCSFFSGPEVFLHLALPNSPDFHRYSENLLTYTKIG